MVPSATNRSEISKELEVYRRAMGTFGFDMAINDRKNIMPSKLHIVSKFNFITFFVLNFKFSMSSLMFLQFIVDTWWETYGRRVPHLQKLVVRILSQTCSSSSCERNWSVFEKIHTKKRNRFENLKLNSKFIITCNLCPMGNLCILNSNWINVWSSYRLDTQRLNDLAYVS